MGVGSGAAWAAPIICKKKKRGGKENGGDVERGENMGRELSEFQRLKTKISLKDLGES